MSIIILIPAMICIWVLLRGSVEQAFRDVYLPVLMLLPTYYFWKVALLPPIDFSEAALLPLGIAIVVARRHRWRFTTADLWMAIFLLSTAYSDYLHNKQTASTFELFANLMWAGVPYLAGKLLIEQPDARVVTSRRILICLFFVCIISGYEYRMGVNPFSMFWRNFFPGEFFDWKTQIRWGFGRVSGPYAQSELAGIIFIFGLVLTLWLGHSKHWEPKFSRARWLPFQKSTLIAALVALTLLMTQARGPWIGALIALPIAFVGRAKNVRLAAILVTLFVATFGSLAYLTLKDYAAQPTTTSAEQQTAQYRQQLLDNYIPIAEHGGAWGWGQDFPRAIGQDSIDNEYLFIALTQGWVGLAAFSFLILETLGKLISAIVSTGNKEDTYFAFSMLGIFVGILFTIFTVYLGNQPYQLFFLLVGWSQSLKLRDTDRVAAAKIEFRQVFTIL